MQNLFPFSPPLWCKFTHINRLPSPSSPLKLQSMMEAGKRKEEEGVPTSPTHHRKKWRRKRNGG